MFQDMRFRDSHPLFRGRRRLLPVQGPDTPFQENPHPVLSTELLAIDLGLGGGRLGRNTHRQMVPDWEESS